jgi:hypothetical protein
MIDIVIRHPHFELHKLSFLLAKHGVHSFRAEDVPES